MITALFIGGPLDGEVGCLESGPYLYEVAVRKGLPIGLDRTQLEREVTFTRKSYARAMIQTRHGKVAAVYVFEGIQEDDAFDRLCAAYVRMRQLEKELAEAKTDIDCWKQRALPPWET